MSVFIDGFEIDVFVSESYRLDSDVTQHPVERGADISDHIRPQPQMITLEGVVSNAPIGQLAERRLSANIEDYKPSELAYQKLLELRENRQPVTIETGVGTFDNMALQSLSIPKSATDGDALRFTATFTQITIVNNETTQIQVAIPRAKRKSKKGNKSARNAATQTGENPDGSDSKVKAPPPAIKTNDTVTELKKSATGFIGGLLE